MPEDIVDMNRTAIAQEAFDSQFSKLDLWNPDIAIARIVAHTWAEQKEPLVEIPGIHPDAVALAGLRYGTDDTETPAELANGIRALPELLDLESSGAPLHRIAILLTLYARYTATHPATDGDLATHQGLVAQCGKDLGHIATLLDQGAALDTGTRITFTAHMDWLAANLPGLWD